jgi:hypothetical protein
MDEFSVNPERELLEDLPSLIHLSDLRKKTLTELYQLGERLGIEGNLQSLQKIRSGLSDYKCLIS